MLLNFETGVFAVSDSSDRAPDQSKVFLVHFDNLVSTFLPNVAERTGGSVNVSALAEKIKFGCEKIMLDMQGPASCTFTGLLVIKIDSVMKALLFHTGDSLLYEYDVSLHSLKTLTANNFWMIGRTLKLYQTAEFAIKPDSTLILATDGVTQGIRETVRERLLAGIIRRNEVENLPEQIINAGCMNPGFRDDAALIALSTSGLLNLPARIIMGGVTAFEEKERMQLYGATCPMDSYVRVTETSSRIDHVF